MDQSRSTSTYSLYTTQLLYGFGLREFVTDRHVAELARAILLRSVYTDPPEDYYCGVAGALKSDEPLAQFEGQREPVARDLLERLLIELDRLRPWPDPPYVVADRGERSWSEFEDSPPLGRIGMFINDVESALNRMFHPLSDDERDAGFLVVHLRTGEDVALVARPPYRNPGIDAHSFAEPSTVRSNFRSLTGMDIVEPRTEPTHR